MLKSAVRCTLAAGKMWIFGKHCSPILSSLLRRWHLITCPFHRKLPDFGFAWSLPHMYDTSYDTKHWSLPFFCGAITAAAPPLRRIGVWHPRPLLCVYHIPSHPTSFLSIPHTATSVPR